MPESALSKQGEAERAVMAICERFGNDRTRLLDILLEVQARFRCVEPSLMECIARRIGTYRVEVEGMVSFYAFFSDSPRGQVVIRLCDDIIDRHAGTEDIARVFSRILGIGFGETSPDGRFTLEYTPCIGMSDQAPAALIDERVVTCLTPARAEEIALGLKQGLKPGELILPEGD